jgi:hypothetical protein
MPFVMSMLCSSVAKILIKNATVVDVDHCLLALLVVVEADVTMWVSTRCSRKV